LQRYQQEDRMQHSRADNSINNIRRPSRRYMLGIGAGAMASAALPQQLGTISQASAETNFSPEELAGLSPHIVYRMTIHCVGPLGFDPVATLAARDWAARSPQDANGRFTHDPNRGAYGENMAWGTNLDASQAVALWYAEGRQYDYNRPGFSPATGHFTQLVWASSRLLGMSMARRGNVNLWVARYSPAGNIMGQFPNNVVPPLGGPLCSLFRSGAPEAVGIVPPAPEPLSGPTDILRAPP
jgi:hypothetical protein